MVILFNKLWGTESLDSNGIKGESLSAEESCEVDEYIRIYKREGFSKHPEVNDFIWKNGLWDNFKAIRSLNDHGNFKEIEGIQPKYFEIICNILNISDEGGLPLDSYTKY